MSDERASNDVTPDEMNLADDYVPGITPGAYRFISQQTVSFTPPGADARPQSIHYYREQPFIVRGPRFNIPAADIRAKYPPEGGQGNYDHILPHLVLDKRALPWERTVASDIEGEPPPWLALLVFSQNELDQGRSEIVAATPYELFNPDTFKEAAVGADNQFTRIKDKGVTLLPELEPGDHKDDQSTILQLLDLPLDLFQALCPTLNDALYLAHVRSIGLDNKSDTIAAHTHAGGDFSILIANRFPQPGANVVHLVSLEGWHTFLDGSRKTNGADRVRLVTLASWRFDNRDSDFHTFGQMLDDLNLDSLRINPAGGEPDPAVARPLSHGYIPAAYRPTGSEPTFAWYRGPFSPVQTAPFNPNGRLFHRADAALVVDPDSGVIDSSYAAAWQLGHLLALATPTFLGDLHHFFRKNHEAFYAAQTVSQFLEMHQIGFEQVVAGKVQAKDDPAEDSVYAEIVAADELLDFLARLVLFHSVPYDYLIAHHRLLPRESLRFFYIDNNWLEAAIDGAFSIGFSCARDHEVAQTGRADLHQAISRLVHQYRAHIRSGSGEIKVPETNPTDYMDSLKSGFLLRSELVSGWPGIEIECYDANGEKMPILRFDHLADDLLLCIVVGQLDHVVFKEPAEGIRYGVDDEDQIMLRYWQSSDQNPPGKEHGFFDYDRQKYSRGGKSVVDISQLAKDIATQIGDRQTDQFRSAAFSLQLLRSPEKRVIYWR